LLSFARASDGQFESRGGFRLVWDYNSLSSGADLRCSNPVLRIWVNVSSGMSKPAIRGGRARLLRRQFDDSLSLARQPHAQATWRAHGAPRTSDALGLSMGYGRFKQENWGLSMSCAISSSRLQSRKPRYPRCGRANRCSERRSPLACVEPPPHAEGKWRRGPGADMNI
jgi:hypothetical protein